jgi:hypothetical protein
MSSVLQHIGICLFPHVKVTFNENKHIYTHRLIIIKIFKIVDNEKILRGEISAVS